MSSATRRCRRVVSPDGLRPSDVLATFFALGVGFLLAAAATGVLYAIADWQPGRWLALHLAFVGGVSQLVIGASQFFAGAFLATTPPSRRLVRAQLLTWNAGAVLVAFGVSARVDPAADLGALLLLAGLGFLAAGLRTLERQSLQRAPWATRWYYACAVFLAIGVVAGAGLARGVAWSAGDLLGAHLALNLAGWFGTAIVGTLHTFYPSLSQTRLARPRLQPPTFIAWVGGVSLLAAGFAFDWQAAAVAGWGGLSLGAALLTANIVLSTRTAPRPLSLSARLIAVAQLFLVAGLAAGFVLVADLGSPVPAAGAERSLLATLLLAGWLGLTVLASLVHLLAVLVRVRNLGQAFSVSSELERRALPVAALVGVAVLAAGRVSDAALATAAGGAVVLVVYLALATRVVTFTARALKRSPQWHT